MRTVGGVVAPGMQNALDRYGSATFMRMHLDLNPWEFVDGEGRERLLRVTREPGPVIRAAPAAPPPAPPAPPAPRIASSGIRAAFRSSYYDGSWHELGGEEWSLADVSSDNSFGYGVLSAIAHVVRTETNHQRNLRLPSTVPRDPMDLVMHDTHVAPDEDEWLKEPIEMDDDDDEKFDWLTNLDVPEEEPDELVRFMSSVSAPAAPVIPPIDAEFNDSIMAAVGGWYRGPGFGPKPAKPPRPAPDWYMREDLTESDEDEDRAGAGQVTGILVSMRGTARIHRPHGEEEVKDWNVVVDLGRVGMDEEDEVDVRNMLEYALNEELKGYLESDPDVTVHLSGWKMEVNFALNRDEEEEEEERKKKEEEERKRAEEQKAREERWLARNPLVREEWVELPIAARMRAQEAEAAQAVRRAMAGGPPEQKKRLEDLRLLAEAAARRRRGWEPIPTAYDQRVEVLRRTAVASLARGRAMRVWEEAKERQRRQINLAPKRALTYAERLSALEMEEAGIRDRDFFDDLPPEYVRPSWAPPLPKKSKRGGRRGGCGTGGCIVEFGGMRYVSVKGGRGECGGRVVWVGVKKHLDRVPVKYHRPFLQYSRFESLSYKLTSRTRLSGEWSLAEMDQFVSACGGNFVCFSTNDVDKAIYGSSKLLSKFEVRVLLSEAESILSEEGGENHFYLCVSVISACSKCGESIGVGDIGPGRRHHCVVVCEQCGVKYYANSREHVCESVMRELTARAEKEEESKHAACQEGSMTSAFEHELRQEVEFILNAELNDDEVVKSWKEAINRGWSCCLLGDAGTGKSVLMGQMAMELIENGLVSGDELAVVCAEAVGVCQYAQLRQYGVHVSTLHSWMGSRSHCKKSNEVEVKQMEKKQPEVSDRLKRTRVLMIEEVSNLSLSLLSQLDMKLKVLRGSGASMGGMQVLVAGDFHQRLPVEGTEPLFMSRMYAEMGMKVFRLRQQKRVIDLTCSLNRLFLRAQLEMSRGVASVSTLKKLQELCYRNDQQHLLDPECVLLVCDNASVWELGVQQIRRFYPEDSIVLKTGVGEVRVQTSVYCDYQLYVAVGCSVMFTVNKYFKEYGCGNGSMGSVESIEEDTIVVRYGHKLVPVVRQSFPTCKYTQFGIRLAYARTIHKSQGATLERVALYLRTSLRESSSSDVALSYVGISRVRDIRKLTIVGLPLSQNHIVVSPVCVMYMQMCDKYLHIEVMERVSKEMGRGLSMYAFNNEAYVCQLGTRRKRAHDKLHTFWARGAVRPPYPLEIWNKRLFFDFETGPIFVDAAPGMQRRTEEPYSVYARYWKSQSVQVEFKERECSGVGCLSSFLEWVMDLGEEDIGE